MSLDITTGVCGDDQQSNMNAVMNVVGDVAVSVTFELPAHFDEMTEQQCAAALRDDFKPLSDIGYSIEIEVGPDEPEDD